MNPDQPDSAPSLDELLDRLDKVLHRLAEGSAPLAELVAAHEEARQLTEQAQARLADLERWAETASSRPTR